MQFVGVPFSFIFGNLPNPAAERRNLYLAFIAFNVAVLPLLAIAARQTLPAALTGAPPPAYQTVNGFNGQGDYPADQFAGEAWSVEPVAGDLLDAESDVPHAITSEMDAAYTIPFNGRRVEITYIEGPDYGQMAVLLDGEPLTDSTDVPIVINANSSTVRYGVTATLDAPTAGQHTLTLVNTTAQAGIGPVSVLPPQRGGNLLYIMGALLAVQAGAALFAVAGGGRLLRGVAESLNTKRSILLSLGIYSVIAVWGYWVNSTVEFWFLAWMVGIVQGGSQALSRSLYASMTPKHKSGEFFGLFSVMSKFSAITGPLLFALAIQVFGQSRPAVLSLIVLFLLGGYLLTRVDVEDGRAVARAENARYAEG